MKNKTITTKVIIINCELFNLYFRILIFNQTFYDFANFLYKELVINQEYICLGLVKLKS